MPLLVLIGFFLVGFASCGAQSLSSFSRSILTDLCERSQKTALLRQILKNYEFAATAAAVLRIILVQVLTVTLFFWIFPMFNTTDAVNLMATNTDKLWFEWTLLVVTASVVTMAGVIWLPYPIAKLWGTHFVFYTWFIWRAVSVVLYPLVIFYIFFDAVFCRLSGVMDDSNDEEAFEDEIRTIVTEGHREGLLEEDAREMIEGVIEMGDRSVSEIMTPRTDMTCIPKTLTWEEMLLMLPQIPHSRIPVYDTNRDDIVGVLNTKDLIPELARENPKDRRQWTELLHDPFFVPETKPIVVLMREFRRNPQRANGNVSDGNIIPASNKPHSHLAVVLDEYGGVSGLVTLEDILEEIVGDITDEYDPIVDEAEVNEVSPDVYEVLGRVHIDDLNEQLGLSLPEDEDYDTIAGLIFSELGHIPHTGETLAFGNEQTINFTVLQVTKRRIEKVRIERNAQR
ncbi:MAG: hemolysin family protein [Planctomycetaceae bacterium]|jgi:CBS domain containing-hemolysin-like protein|nr:hemolysin family protein [Planctomycetaceae bacterium]